jgi:hypothetical protein
MYESPIQPDAILSANLKNGAFYCKFARAAARY